MELKKNVAKGMVLIFIVCSFLLFSGVAQAQYQTNLLSGVYVQDNGVKLDAGNWSAPTVYDWDNDGANDLLVGRRDAVDTMGYISFYKNYGTNALPVFNGYVDIQSCTAPCYAAG